ncbi:group 1 truncated hemoglobin [Polaromonas sp.]|uniref:group I truncated hemoglobin n=1 Tax=Polaromonas sp. TaxID=1869339 RepID=UPI0013BA9E48|nr:group 1 truncated hemoglobin [Polaromonas sp.]NDP61867.1 group 1 truncated hemoglobin [Polaromonas sp.]
MKKPLLAFILAAAGCLTAGLSSAQTTSMNDQLYKAFGEKAGLVTLMDDFMTRLLADPRTGPHFKPANQQHVKEQLVEQFCALGGGPCVYQGADMKTAHAELDIRKSDFHALVEVLQRSMDAQGIAFARQNQMLALLAPMHSDTITVR